MARDTTERMLSPVYNWIRTLNDPFRNAHTAGRWVASLPAVDALSIQKEALDDVRMMKRHRQTHGASVRPADQRDRCQMQCFDEFRQVGSMGLNGEVPAVVRPRKQTDSSTTACRN